MSKRQQLNKQTKTGLVEILSVMINNKSVQKPKTTLSGLR